MHGSERSKGRKALDATSHATGPVNEHIRICMRCNYMLVCAVRIIGAGACDQHACILRRMHHFERLPMGDSSTMMQIGTFLVTLVVDGLTHAYCIR